MSDKPFRLHRVWAPWAPLLIIIDALLVYLSGVFLVWILATQFGRNGFWPLPDAWITLLFAVAITFPLVMQLLGLYQPSLEPFGNSFVKKRLGVWTGLMVLLVLWLFATKTGAQFSRLWIVSWYFFVSVLLFFETLFLHKLLAKRKSQGKGVRRLLIAGSGPLAKSVTLCLQNNTWLGLKPIGYLTEGDECDAVEGLPCLGSIEDVELAVSKFAIQEVWLTLPLTYQPRIQQVLKKMRQNLVDVRLVPDIFMYDILNRDFDEVLGFPVIGLTTSPQRGLDFFVKRVIDIAGALFGGLLLVPVMAMIALAIKMDSPGGVFFRQQRHGLDGNAFTTLKFRTMVINGLSTSAFRQATRDDPRITRAGRFLRKYSLDELPQLFNVLTGDMSLVGPRPHPVNMNINFWDDIDRYALRHRVKPGVTGWAQVHGLRGETSDVSLLRKRIEYDLFYIDNWSIALDIKILIRTLFVVWSQPSAY